MRKLLIMTGGSRGIGKQTIAQFRTQGWDALNISRNKSTIAGVTNVVADLADPQWTAQCRQVLHAAAANADSTCLVHNAAIYEKDNIATLTEAQLRHVLEVNLIAAVTLNTICIPFMKAGSSIIYIGSTVSEQAVPNRASYVISKHAVVGLMRSTCQDLAGKNISTCCICPGFVNTNMLTDGADASALQAFIQQKVTAGRLIEPQEIAELIYFSATHPVVNGALIHANLGQISS